MKSALRIVLFLSLVLLGVTGSTAQCLHDNRGRKLNLKQQAKAKADAPLIKAVETNDLNALKSALKNGVSVDARDCESGSTALILTIVNDNPEMMRILISRKANVNLQNNSGFTALMYAVGWGRIDVVKELLAAGSDVNLRTHDGDLVTALGIAQRYSSESMVQIATLLKANGAIK